MIIPSVKLTKSGLLVRNEGNVGISIYSPFSGLFFVVNNTDEKLILNWLEKTGEVQPPDEYIESLGAGWVIPTSEAVYPDQNLLPKNFEYWSILRPENPFLINWLLTGNCPLNCQYCYAQDLMHCNCKEPNLNQIRKISHKILSFNPLAVVLTGGDPLCSPHLLNAIELLHEKTGIIIDTSGYLFNEEHLEIFKRYNIFIRVSLDSEFPRINNSLRPIEIEFKPDSHLEVKNTTEAALNLISRCVDSGIKVGVQTVVTKKNYTDLEPFGDKLYRIGVCNWRIMMIAPSKERYDNYIKLRGNEKRYYNHIERQLRMRHKREWNKGMSVQLVKNTTPNAVVLVSPEGNFYTESNIKPGKVRLDDKGKISFKQVNMHAQVERYLNLKKT